MARSVVRRPAPVRPLANWRLLFLVTLIVSLVGLLSPASTLLELKIWVASWFPWAGAIDPSDSLSHVDKWIHLVIFLGLGVLGVCGWRLDEERRQLFLGLLVMALMTESLQHFIPGRSASLADLAADVAGLSLVALAFLTPRDPAHLYRRES